MYQALYRKWRPKTFDDVVGQSHITRTLKKQITTKHLSHAYLFTGTRGTGKTTCAKLMAKAVNCQNPIEGNPCGQCAACQGIESGSILDVVELDAASNNGVDQVRALRDEAVYSPAAVQYRVYIVDEVHMLSIGAFNALLKILEEPPEHVIFILATTELHKVPATILSRCQRFSFKRIQPSDIQNRLLYIAECERISLTEDGASILARLADGALRDALSLLDQCAISGQTVDKEAVLDVLGLAGNTRTAHLMNHVRRNDTASALNELADLYAAGKDVSSVLSELSGLTRDLLLRMTTGGSTAGLMSGGYDEKTLVYLSKGFTPQRLLHNLNLIQDALTKLKNSTDRRTDAELCLIQLCDKRLDGSVLSISERLTKLEAAIAKGEYTVPFVEAPSGGAMETEPIPTEDIVEDMPEQPPMEAYPVPEEEYPFPVAEDIPIRDIPPMEELPSVQEVNPEPYPADISRPVRTVMPENRQSFRQSRTETAVKSVADPKFWQELAPSLMQQVGFNFFGYLMKNMLTGLFDGTTLTVYAPDSGSCQWLSNQRDKQIVETAATAKAGYPVRVAFEVQNAADKGRNRFDIPKASENTDPMSDLLAFGKTELGKEILTID